MSQMKMGVTWELFQEAFVAVREVGLPARLPGAGWPRWPGARASAFTADGAARCRQRCWKLPELLCSALYSLGHDAAMWEKGRVTGNSWSLFSSSGSQGKKTAERCVLSSSEEASVLLLPVLGRDINA